MVADDDNKDISAPLLRPDMDDRDKAIYNRICAKLNLDPKVRDNDTQQLVGNFKYHKNILIYNLHEDKDVVKTFYCNTLHSRSLCKKYSAKHSLLLKNVGFPTYFDSIAVAAYHHPIDLKLGAILIWDATS